MQALAHIASEGESQSFLFLGAAGTGKSFLAQKLLQSLCAGAPGGNAIEVRTHIKGVTCSWYNRGSGTPGASRRGMYLFLQPLMHLQTCCCHLSRLHPHPRLARVTTPTHTAWPSYA